MSDINIPDESAQDDVDPRDPESEEASSYNISPDPRGDEAAEPDADTSAAHDADAGADAGSAG